MTPGEVWTWLLTGHRHTVTSMGLAPARARGGGHAELVDVERCGCGAVRPSDGSQGWTIPREDS